MAQHGICCHLNELGLKRLLAFILGFLMFQVISWELRVCSQFLFRFMSIRMIQVGRVYAGHLFQPPRSRANLKVRSCCLGLVHSNSAVSKGSFHGLPECLLQCFALCEELPYVSPNSPYYSMSLLHLVLYPPLWSLSSLYHLSTSSGRVQLVPLSALCRQDKSCFLSPFYVSCPLTICGPLDSVQFENSHTGKLKTNRSLQHSHTAGLHGVLSPRAVSKELFPVRSVTNVGWCMKWLCPRYICLLNSMQYFLGLFPSLLRSLLTALLPIYC